MGLTRPLRLQESTIGQAIDALNHPANKIAEERRGRVRRALIDAGLLLGELKEELHRPIEPATIRDAMTIQSGLDGIGVEGAIWLILGDQDDRNYRVEIVTGQEQPVVYIQGTVESIMWMLSVASRS